MAPNELVDYELIQCHSADALRWYVAIDSVKEPLVSIIKNEEVDIDLRYIYFAALESSMKDPEFSPA